MQSRRARRPATPILRVAPLLLLTTLFRPAHAATPGSGTVSLGNPSVTWSGSISGAGSGENTCVDGVSCDSFQVTLAPGDYTGKQLNVVISWTIPAYDYDLYVHEGTLRGPLLPASAGPPPATSETVHIGIDPPVVTSPRVWWAHIQAATVPPAQVYQGQAAIGPTPPSPVITHLPGHVTFSHTVPLYARGTVRTEEPSVRVDVRGNCYVSGIRGVPAGVDLWRFDLNPASPTFDPEMRNGVYLGQPDAFQQMGAEDSTAGGADGGGDIDIATSFPTSPDSTPVLTMVSLAVADISSNLSTDRGQSFQHDLAAAAIPSDDRQWIEADGPNNVYMVYRGVVPSNALFVQKSTDHGLTYGTPSVVLDASNPITTSPGYIDVDHTNGYVYVSHQNDNALYVSRSTDGGSTWTTRLVDGLTAHGHLFDPVKVGDDGTVYTCWSNDRHIYYSFSLDHGDTWTVPAAVDDPDSSFTNVFPWLEAGSAGRVDVVWFGTPSANTTAAEWDVYFSQSLNANTGSPVFRQQRISDHRVHGSNISEGGLTGSANRNLGDYFQIAYDPQGAAVISFADDHNDFDGNTFVVRQLDGPSLLAAANGGTGAVAAVTPTALPMYSWSEPEVTDPVHDAVLQTQPIPTDNPFDIVSIQYFADENGPNAPYVGARMKVSSLTASPPNGVWRMAFTANAPWADDQLPYGVSDHGNMFYIMAADTGAVPTFSYGTAYRDSMPLTPAMTAYAMAYNYVGVADSGSIDTANATITVKVALSKINALIPPSYLPIVQGSWLSGLRGSAGAVGNGPRDNTRGGRFNFLVNFNGPTAVGPGGPPSVLSLAASPNPSRAATTLFYSMPVTEPARIALYDVRGRLVSVLRSGVFPAGSSEFRWDGRAGGRETPEGVYFAALETRSGQRTVSRFVRLR
ncbi:MAG TPA: sialidase family protein [Candidatus Eisenbacteria bacterium]|nr:sialidase family protein [Candidatus Eisenbacteria bacterium]